MLLDTASLYFRAYYGVPDTIRAPDGQPVNAVRGLLDFISRLVAQYSPTHLACCWDNDWRPQWRVDLLPTYKGHRVVATRPGESPDIEEVPDPLNAQIPIIIAALNAFGIAIVGANQHEADDVIGTLDNGVIGVLTDGPQIADEQVWFEMRTATITARVFMANPGTVASLPGSTTPITINGRIAAQDSAAIDHQLIPCDPV